MSKLKIGTIPFLNTKPITYGIERGLGEGRFDVEFHPPSTGARLLAEGKLDLVLLPTIEYARNEGLHIVPGISVAARGEVLSVLLLSDKPLSEIESIAVDDRSRTSVALLRILCGLASPDNGKVLLGDQDLFHQNREDVRRTFAMVSPDLPLLRGSLRLNLTYCAGQVDEDKLIRVVRSCGLMPLVERLHKRLDTRISESGAGLSTGERARIALGRALETRFIDPAESAHRVTQVGLRPEDVVDPQQAGEERCLHGRVVLTELLGREQMVYLDLRDGTRVVARLHADHRLPAGEEIAFGVDPGRLYLFEKEGLALTYR